jgi:uncharacterized protein YjbI with pentapeptide repeats
MLNDDATQQKIRPEDNVWYLLATLYGQPREGDRELQARNRIAWNRYMARWLDEDAKAKIANTESHAAEDTVPFSEAEMTSLREALAKRHHEAGSEADPQIGPEKPSHIDFSDVKFDRLFWVEGFVFPLRTYFPGAIFSEGARFQGAIFSERLVFNRAVFSRWADFTRATFREAEFQRVKFEGGVVMFDNAVVSSWADFEDATFSYASFPRVDFTAASFRRAKFGSAEFPGATFGKASFPGATFEFNCNFENTTFRGAGFDGATFERDANFVNTDMKGPTSFESVRFKSRPPRFSGAKLHEGTVWRKAIWPLPDVSATAGDFIDAYERLKLEMDRLKKHEDELDFFALEMQSRRVMHGDWAPTSELRILGRTIPLGPLKIPQIRITSSSKKLFGLILPLIRIEVRKIALKRPASGLPIAVYGFLCDYGRSYVRPLVGLLVTAGAGALSRESQVRAGASSSVPNILSMEGNLNVD